MIFILTLLNLLKTSSFEDNCQMSFGESNPLIEFENPSSINLFKTDTVENKLLDFSDTKKNTDDKVFIDSDEFNIDFKKNTANNTKSYRKKIQRLWNYKNNIDVNFVFSDDEMLDAFLNLLSEFKKISFNQPKTNNSEKLNEDNLDDLLDDSENFGNNPDCNFTLTNYNEEFPKIKSKQVSQIEFSHENGDSDSISLIEEPWMKNTELYSQKLKNDLNKEN